MKRILLKNGQIVSSKGVVQKDLLIENGIIAEIFDSKSRKPHMSGTEIFDCKGKYIFPGLIDVHVHLREPGATQKEDFATGTAAAAAGGVTTVFDMPNNKPPTVSNAALSQKRKLIKGRAYVNYGFYIGYDGKNISEIVKAKNVAGVKVYVANSTGDMGVSNETLEALFKKTDKKIVLHCEDESCVKKNMDKILAEYKGRIDTVPACVHSEIRSTQCAVAAVKYVCELAKKLKRPVHIAHISTEEELEIISKYRKYGVTCEVTPHHLVLSEDDYDELENFLKVNPPVRSRADLFGIYQGLKNRKIDIVASDHAPHTIEEKYAPYIYAPAGVPELDTFGPWLFNTIDDGGFSFEQAAEFCCEKPAELFGIKRKGFLKEGYDADIVVVDMEMKKTIAQEMLYTKCAWSPYQDFTFKGWPVMTFVNGELVCKDGDIVGKPVGKEIKF